MTGRSLAAVYILAGADSTEKNVILCLRAIYADLQECSYAMTSVIASLREFYAVAFGLAIRFCVEFRRSGKQWRAGRLCPAGDDLRRGIGRQARGRGTDRGIHRTRGESPPSR